MTTALKVSASDPTVRLSFSKRATLTWRFFRLWLSEFCHYDCRACRRLLAWLGYSTGFLLSLAGQRNKAFRLWTSLHRSNHDPFVNRLVLTRVQRELQDRERRETNCFAQHVDRITPSPATQRFFDDPLRLIGSRVLALKSPRDREKGVIAVDYNFALPVFARLFDFEEIGRRYYVVIEPSWSGYCDFDLLCLSRYHFPIFVQAFEPRDRELVESLGVDFIPVPTATNWWVDHRVLHPLPDVSKDADVVMVASWSVFKRHRYFFRVLQHLQRQGIRLRAILIGYPIDCTMDDIRLQARYYGVEDQVELKERLTPAEMNVEYNRAKVNLVWSRKEGVNRAIIEGMFAGVPCILREGFNYGYHYPYINPQTAVYANESNLAETLLRMTRPEGGDSGQFCTRDWVMEHMSCQRSTQLVEEAIRRRALSDGEVWTQGLAVKTTHLNSQSYFDPDDAARFAPDHNYLKSMLRR